MRVFRSNRWATTPRRSIRTPLNIHLLRLLLLLLLLLLLVLLELLLLVLVVLLRGRPIEVRDGHDACVEEGKLLVCYIRWKVSQSSWLIRASVNPLRVSVDPKCFWANFRYQVSVYQRFIILFLSSKWEPIGVDDCTPPAHWC